MSGHHCPRSTKKLRVILEALLWAYDDVDQVMPVGRDQLRVRYDDGTAVLFSLAAERVIERPSPAETRKALQTLPGGSRISHEHPFWEQLRAMKRLQQGADRERVGT